MKMACFSLVLALAALCRAQSGFPAAPTQVIDQFVVLVHPCPYEAAGKPATDPYRAIERAACQRWFDAIPSLPQSTFVIEVDFPLKGPSPDLLHQALIDHLGAGHVSRNPAAVVSPEDPGPLKEYYAQISQRARQQMTSEGLTFNPETVKTTIWGQSFEGCASGYGSALANYLGLKTPTRFDYNMSAPDAPFLLKAKFLQTVAVPASDVEAYVFDLRDGRFAAFFRSCLTPQWLDYRPIVLPLDSQNFSVLTKNKGLGVWPAGPLPSEADLTSSAFRQWRTVPWPAGTPPAGPNSFTLSTVQERYVVSTNLEDLISVVKSAKLKSPAE